MPNNVYSEIHLHITWHTKHGVLIEPAFEARLHQFIRSYAAQTAGVRVHAVNGTADHIHLAVSIPPTLNTSEWLGKLKGASTHHVNHRLINRRAFGWQQGYGVLSFGTKDLPWVVEYVQRQKEHHTAGTAQERLERTVSPLKRAEEEGGRAAFGIQP
jgi:putative transposase